MFPHSVPAKIPLPTNHLSCYAIKMLVIVRATLRHGMYTNDIDNQSGAAPWRRLGRLLTSLGAVKVPSTSNRHKMFRSGVSPLDFSIFPPFKLRYVIVNPVKVTPEIKYLCSLCRLTLRPAGPVRSGPADWVGSAPLHRSGSARLVERAEAVWTRREIRAGRSAPLCSRGGSQSEASAGQVGGLFTSVTDRGQRRADRERHSRVSSPAAMWQCLFITRTTPRHSSGAVDLLESNICRPTLLK